MASFDICIEYRAKQSNLEKSNAISIFEITNITAPKYSLLVILLVKKFLLLVIVHNCAKSNLRTTLGDNITIVKATIYIFSNISIRAQISERGNFSKDQKRHHLERLIFGMIFHLCLIIGKGNTLEMISFGNWVFNIGFLLICRGAINFPFSNRQIMLQIYFKTYILDFFVNQKIMLQIYFISRNIYREIYYS